MLILLLIICSAAMLFKEIYFPNINMNIIMIPCEENRYHQIASLNYSPIANEKYDPCSQICMKIDLNDDGVYEYIIDGSKLHGQCGSGGCSTYIYQIQNGRYVKIADLFGASVEILRYKKNGYYGLFLRYKHYLPKGGFTDATTFYFWNKYKKKYTESKIRKWLGKLI